MSAREMGDGDNEDFTVRDAVPEHVAVAGGVLFSFFGKKALTKHPWTALSTRTARAR